MNRTQTPSNELLRSKAVSIDLLNSMIYLSRRSVDLGWMIEHQCYIHPWKYKDRGEICRFTLNFAGRNDSEIPRVSDTKNYLKITRTLSNFLPSCLHYSFSKKNPPGPVPVQYMVHELWAYQICRSIHTEYVFEKFLFYVFCVPPFMSASNIV